MVIDTNIFIEFLRSKNKKGTTLFKIPDAQTKNISSITLFELYSGATSKVKWNEVIKITREVNILPVTEEIAIESAKIYQELKAKNKIIEYRDIMIAATTIVHQQSLLTLNRKHFSRIPNIEFVLID